MAKGQAAVIGFALLTAVFVFFLVAFATIDPLIETLDISRNQTSLNCPGTPGFDSVDYNNDTDFEQLVRRPTCFVTGITMVYFIGAFLISVVAWLIANWRRSA